MGDRLSEINVEIQAHLSEAKHYGYSPDVWAEHIVWLIAENERLTAELASLRDHPGWVPPQTGSEK